MWPKLTLDIALIGYGAATHDIGKVWVTSELFEPGSVHETRWQAELVSRGVALDAARFSVSHALAPDDPRVALDDLIVMTVDKVWKGSRKDAVEERLAAVIAATVDADFWEVFPNLTALLEELAAGADVRLAWQNQYSVTS